MLEMLIGREIIEIMKSAFILRLLNDVVYVIPASVITLAGSNIYNWSLRKLYGYGIVGMYRVD